MNWELIANMVIVYVIGVVLTLLFLNKYGKQMELGDYDPPHDGWYDDYESNAQAWLSFSIVWPMFWIIGILFGIYSLLLQFSKYLYKIYNG